MKEILSPSSQTVKDNFSFESTMPEMLSQKRLSLSLTALFLISSYLDPDSAESTKRETAGRITVS